MKGHWPSGRRRHPDPPDWPRIVAAMNEAAKRRQTRLLTRKAKVHEDTIRRWRKGIDMPEPDRVQPLIDALYALRLYWVRTGRLAASAAEESR